MNVEHAVALVTGANRGIGRAIVERLLAAGVKKLYAAGRDAAALSAVVSLDPKRVVALVVDVTDAGQVDAAVARAGDVTLLVNNAGVADFGDALSAPHALVERNFSTNFYGVLAMAQGFAPVIERNGGGGIANLLSIVAVAAMPGAAGYSASKAAAHSLTQSLRGSLKAKEIAVFGIFPGPVDTDMAASLDMAKTSPADVAEAIVAGIAAGEEDIFPDATSRQIGAIWRKDPKAAEAQFAEH
ncbi:SDR family oxidoreductase [Plastoroseomonas arctica]|uniref:SDR family NAD(P)-dependent oxidoreductase n=1 Tax=Plastoroseomonas arctica TaxID=1509237 RepID=A0AAF1KQE9_9PROT|nr:SDR family oxidoreductase [Plastoroseomonas arctica]MBR0657583.1 SDR family NAD(P)-dependent oxidoreductase [Plastoroseomonas arctica]